MSRLSRITQKLFGSTATTNQIAQYGSLAAGTPVRFSGPTADPAAIQSLGNFLQGWFGASIGSNSPAEEDMNALFYLAFYQLCQIFQSGIPEYDSGTTYYKGSIVQDGTGVTYVSLIDSNVGNALTNTSDWGQSGAPAPVAQITLLAGILPPYTMTSADNGKIFQVSGPGTINLPTPSVGFRFTVFMQLSATSGSQIGGGSANSITLHRHGTELIQGKGADLILRAPYGRWTLICGPDLNWYIDA